MTRPSTSDADQVIFDASLQTGIASIDEQHGHLIDELNRLISAPLEDLSSELFSEVLSRLGRDLFAHFEHEERWLERRQVQRQQLDAHIAAHASIVDQYTDLNLRLMDQRLPHRTEVVSMIKRWIVDHIALHDLHVRAPSGA